MSYFDGFERLDKYGREKSHTMYARRNESNARVCFALSAAAFDAIGKPEFIRVVVRGVEIGFLPGKVTDYKVGTRGIEINCRAVAEMMDKGRQYPLELVDGGLLMRLEA